MGESPRIGLVSGVTATKVFTVLKLFVFVFAKEVLRRILVFKFSIPPVPPRRQRQRAKDVEKKRRKKRPCEEKRR